MQTLKHRLTTRHGFSVRAFALWALTASLLIPLLLIATAWL
jgi:hypothetical protein